ncbi:MAG: DUF368 domain-containing protein [Pseudomonadales bacterium]|jgi:putative membrane protein|nr:DUF368 domain-containing protein [Pseudomonadales bacterium]
MKLIKCFAYGLIFGFGSPIPGVSAGTVAILLNVYDSFFKSISIAYAKKNILPIISFLLGWTVGLLSISNTMMFLFDHHGQIISFAFMGLILGCVPLIYKKSSVKKIKIRHIAIFIIAFALMVFLAFHGGDLMTNNTLEQLGGTTPALLAWIFIASTISSMAILIPGVGGSLIMIVFGIYTIYIETLASLNLTVLAVFAASMVLGVLLGIIVIKKMLATCPQLLYCAILGFVVGSLLIIYPGFSIDITGLLSIVLACLGFVFAYCLSKKC